MCPNLQNMYDNQNMEQTNDDVDIKTWNKLENTASNAGYRDGISDGRESNFQTGFDKGYECGFKTGFALGLYKGTLKFQKNENLSNNSILEKSTTGNCQMCTIKNIENEDMSHLESLQKDNYETSIHKLTEDYPQVNYKQLSNKETQ